MSSDTSPVTGSQSDAAPGSDAVAVVYNPASGNSDDSDELRVAFADAGVEAQWLATTEDDPGTGQAAGAVASGAATVVACGGDGTVRAVMQSVAGTATVLGVVPMGTGNLLAGNLGLSTGLDAIDVAVHAPPSRLDVGVINGERFAVMAGVGFDALMIRDANPALKRRIGSAAYVLSAARNLRSKVFHADVAVDGRRQFRGRTAMVLIGNCGAVTGGLEVFPEARHDDGVLDIAVLRAHGVRQWLSVGWRLLTGRAQRPELVHRCQGTSVVVTTGRPVPYELDGEVRDPTRVLTVGVEPGALLVRCPVPPAR
jgi:diacylglycerol kinase family enzyme